MSFRPKQGYTASLLRITSLAEIPAQLRVEKVREGKGHGWSGSRVRAFNAGGFGELG